MALAARQPDEDEQPNHRSAEERAQQEHWGMGTPPPTLTPGSQSEDRPKLSSIDGGGESTPGRGDLKAVPEPGEGGVEPKGPVGAESLAAGKGIAILSKGIGRFTSKNKRGLAVGGGVASIFALIIIAFLALLPLKLEHMMKNIIEKRFARVEFALEKRAEKHVEKYLEYKVRKSASGSSPVIVTGNLASDLFANWEANKFEDKLAKDLGVEFKFNKKDGTYSVIQGLGGKEIALGKASDFGGGGINFDHIGNNQFRALINDAVKKETKWNQFYKRIHTRRILTLKYGVKKYIFFPNTREKVAKVKYDAKHFLKTELISRVVEPVSSKYAIYFQCIVDGCSEDELRSQLGEDAVSPGGTSNPEGTDFNSTTKDKKEAETRATNAQADLDRAAGNNAAEAAKNDVLHIIDEEAANLGAKETEKLAGEGIIKQMQKLMANKILQSIAGGIGILELISKLDTALHNDTIGRIIASKNALQYANEFSTFATISDQIKEGKATGEEVSAVMEQIGDYGQSKVYERQSGIDPGSQTIQCSGDPHDITTADVCADKMVNNNGASDVSKTIRESPLFAPIHAIAVAYQDSIGGLYETFTSFTGGILDAVIGPILDKVLDALAYLGLDIKAWMTDGFNAVLGYFFGPIISGNETGADLYNAVDAGADVTANAQMQSAGGVALPPGVASQLDPLVEQERVAAAKQQSLWNQIASFDNTDSLASSLLVSVVMTPRQLLGRLGDSLIAVITAPTRVFANATPQFVKATISPAYADVASTDDPYGIKQYDFDPATLDTDVLETQRIDGKGPCPSDPNDPYYQTRINETQPDVCRLDIVATQSLNASNKVSQ